MGFFFASIGLTKTYLYFKITQTQQNPNTNKEHVIMVTDTEFTTLLAENPDFQKAWDSLGPALQNDFKQSMSVAGLRSFLLKKVSITARDAASTAHSTQVADAFRNANPAAGPANKSGGDLEGLLTQV